MGEQPWPAWHERVGARHVSWWQEVLIFFPLGALSVLFANADNISSLLELFQWTLVGLAGSLAGSLIFSLLIMRIKRVYSRGLEIGPAPVVISGLLIGLVFGISVVFMEMQMELPISEPLWVYLVGSAVIIGWLGIAISLALDARYRLREDRARLVEEAVALELSRITATSIVEEIRDQVSDHVESSLVNARVALDERIIQSNATSTSAHWPQLAEILRNTAKETVRPLSKDLWNAASEPFHRNKAWSIFKFVLGNQPLRPMTVSIIYLLGSGVQTLQLEGTVRGLFELAIAVFLISVVMVGANTLMRRRPRNHTKIFVSASLLLQVPVLVDYFVSESRGDATTSFVEVMGTVISGLLVIFLTSAFGALFRVNMEQLSVVSADIDREFVEASARNKVLARVLKDASSIVHGTVQGRLLACAMSVEKAGQARDIDQMYEALERARQELDNPLPDLTKSSLGASLTEELARRKALWSGLCDVRIECPASTSSISAQAVESCSLIVEEAIANAIRHGDARTVTVYVSAHIDEPGQQSFLHLKVIDDGVGVVEGKFVPGVGLSMIADLATSWSLSTVDGHGLLEVELVAN